MEKSMFLLQVYDCNCTVFKRRISDNLSSIEDWVSENAQKWAWLPVKVEHDGYGHGKVFLADNRDSVLFTYSATNIAVI